MSRSFKKNKIQKDKSRFSQKLGNRLFRRKTKNKLQNHLINEDTMLPINKSEVVNDYNVTDWILVDYIGKWLGRGKKNKLFK